MITCSIALVRLKQLLIGPLATTMRVSLVILAMCCLQNIFSLLDVIPLALTQFLYLFPLTSLLSFCLYLFLDVLSMVPDQLRDYSSAQNIWVLDQLSKPIWRYLSLIMMAPSVIVLGGLSNTASEDLAFMLQFIAVICTLVLMSLSVFAMFSGRALIVKLLKDLKNARAVLRAAQPQATPTPKSTSNGHVVSRESGKASQERKSVVSLENKLEEIIRSLTGNIVTLISTAVALIYVAACFNEILTIWPFRIPISAFLQYICPISFEMSFLITFRRFDPVYGIETRKNLSSEDAAPRPVSTANV